MPLDDPQNFRAQLRSQRKEVKKLDSESDIDAIEDYINRDKNKETSTIINHVSCLRILSQNAEKPLLEHNGVELDELIINVSKKRGWSDGTQRNYEKSARVFLAHHGFQDEAEEIEFTEAEQNEIKKEDTLSAEDIKKLLTECARMDRDRAMIYLMYETGARLSAILSLRISDVQFGEGPGNSTLVQFPEEAKGLKGAGGHSVIVKPSEVYLENYISREHPDPENPDAPFFAVTKDHYEEDKDNSLIPSFFRRRMRRLVKDSDIPEEKVNPHSFRHSRVTQMRLEGYTDRQISDHMNWGPNSNQLDLYDHTEDEDRHAEMAEKMGLNVEDADIRTPMLDECPRCNYSIDDWLNWTQCPRCQAQLKLHREPEWFETYMELVDDDQDDPIYRQFLRNPHELYDDFFKIEEETRIRISERVANICGEEGIDIPNEFQRDDVISDNLADEEINHMKDDPMFRHED
ncbi:site-specific integrase [Halanaeroarchaeum sp. HSR-CO]|uniref:tyrosine-type recombinase/integrase n=1 Tax=Halanaeroarchaeum sp. HSR-CO TaxID=2866382 RepID=UPI00217E7384|nr:site-specific integrase [Halanaeroarchaeum sp. HSR-CO]